MGIGELKQFWITKPFKLLWNIKYILKMKEPNNTRLNMHGPALISQRNKLIIWKIFCFNLWYLRCKSKVKLNYLSFLIFIQIFWFPACYEWLTLIRNETQCLDHVFSLMFGISIPQNPFLQTLVLSIGSKHLFPYQLPYTLQITCTHMICYTTLHSAHVIHVTHWIAYIVQ